MKFLFITLIALLPILGSASEDKGKGISPEAVKQQNMNVIKMAAEEMSKSLPTVVDKKTNLVNIKADGTTLVYIFEIDTTPKSDETVKKEDHSRMQKAVTEGVCRSSERFLKSDISIRYIYKNTHSKAELFKFDINKESCPNLWLMNKNISIKGIINSLDFFSSLNTEQVEFLTSISSVNNYSKNYIVYYEKQKSDSLLFLLDGLAKAYKIDKHNNEIFLHYIYPNSLISEISNVKQDTIVSFSNIELLEDSQILNIDYKKFRENFLEKGFLCSEFANEIVLKSQQLRSLINREFIFNSVVKVAIMLYNDLNIFNNLKRSEISLILHIQPETLSRVLNRLKRDKIIDSKNGKIVVLDEEALLSICEE